MNDFKEVAAELLSRPTALEDLTLWLTFEAFKEVEGWRQFDTGDIGYSYPKDAPEVEDDLPDPPRLIVRRSEYFGWSWYIQTDLYGGESGCTTGFALAGQAVEAGLKTYNELLSKSL